MEGQEQEPKRCAGCGATDVKLVAHGKCKRCYQKDWKAKKKEEKQKQKEANRMSEPGAKQQYSIEQLIDRYLDEERAEAVKEALRQYAKEKLRDPDAQALMCLIDTLKKRENQQAA